MTTLPPQPDRYHESEGRFRAAFAQSIVGIVHTDLQGRVLLANEAFCRLVGHASEALVGNDSRTYTHPDDRELNLNNIRQLNVDGAASTIYEKRYIRGTDGATVYAQVSLSPVRDASGTTVGLIGIVEDLTARHRAETTIRDAAERFRLLSELGERTRDLSDPAAVMAEAARMLGGHLRASRCAYADVADDAEHFTIRHDYTDGVASTVGDYELSLFGAHAAAAQRSGRTLIVNDVDQELSGAPDAGVAMFTAIGIKAIVCCPLIRGGQLRAMMAVHQSTPRIWTNDEISLIEAVVERCWAYVERARVARDLVQSETRFRQLADAMPQIVFAADANGNVDYFNRRWYEYTGLDEGLVGDSWGDIVPADLLPAIGARWMESVRTGAPYDVECPLRDAGGIFRWHLGRALPIRDANGRIVRWFGTNTDIHDRKLAEEALRRGEARLNDMVRTALDCIVGMDHVGRITVWNPAAVETFGYTAEEAIGREMADLIIPSALRERHRAGLSRFLETGVGPVIGRRLELTAIRRDGSEFPVELTITPVTLASPPAFTGYIRDITQRKLAEAQRERLLEAEQSARAEAERASRTKDEFLATLSHELRTPLSAILGWSQILRRGTATPATLAEGLSTIERNARAQTQIIDDLLDMSRIISGKISLDVQRIDLLSVVRAAIETVRPASTAKEIDVTLACAEAQTPILADPNRLQQVFWNLMSNAIKFTPARGRVEVLLVRDGSQWRVDVIDTGEGIVADFLPFVFDRFRQADASTTRQHGGLGLGLAIVRQLTELHGGSVGAASGGRGRGATFSVSLPVAQERMLGASPTTTANRTPPPGSVPRAPANLPDAWDDDLLAILRGRTALVVDDEEDARRMLVQLLNECGMTVVTAGSASEAFDRINGDLRPDVLVSDVGMPGEDGYSLLTRIRGLGPTAGGNVPAIALTAYARADDRVRAIRAGFQMHVPKPVEPAELVTMVASLVARSK